jgi:hypothetical protein
MGASVKPLVAPPVIFEIWAQQDKQDQTRSKQIKAHPSVTKAITEYTRL